MLEFPLGSHFLPQWTAESCLTFADAGTCVWLSRYSQGLTKLDGKCRDCLLQGQCVIGEAASAKQRAQACQQLSKKLQPGDVEGSAINTTKEWQIKTYRVRYTSSGKIYGNFLYYTLGQRGNYATTIRALSKVSSDSSLAAELKKNLTEGKQDNAGSQNLQAGTMDCYSRTMAASAFPASPKASK